MARYTDDELRRLDFLFWHPYKLLRHVLKREHPVMEVFNKSKGRRSSERVLMFSLALVGSLVAAALFYDTGVFGCQPRGLFVIMRCLFFHPSGS